MLIFSRYTWWVAAMIGLAVLLTGASQAGILNPVQGVFLTVTSPVENLLSGTFQPVASFLSDAGDVNSLQEENRRLRVENEALQNKVVGLQEDAERVKELEEALKITQGAKNETRLAANIVHRDASPFTDVVSIDRGTGAGVKVGMVVVSAQGTLMGTVTKVLDDQAFVRLITDTKSKVAAQVLDSKADGIVTGTPNRGLSFDLAQADIKVGDMIVTSALTGRFPAGLPIGRVTEVGGTTQDLFRTVKLEPLVRISTARTVLVLTSFTPADVGSLAP
jgi:rod shape-determining protein MreC